MLLSKSDGGQCQPVKPPTEAFLKKPPLATKLYYTARMTTTSKKAIVGKKIKNQNTE